MGGGKGTWEDGERKIRERDLTIFALNLIIPIGFCLLLLIYKLIAATFLH